VRNLLNQIVGLKGASVVFSVGLLSILVCGVSEKALANGNGTDDFVKNLVSLDFDTDDVLFKLPTLRKQECSIRSINDIDQSRGVSQVDIRSSVSRGDSSSKLKSTEIAPAIIYDTTRISNQGAEITADVNGPATALGDLITLGGTNRSVTNVQITVFTLASTAPFSLTMRFYTDCSTSGAANSPCGNGTGTLIPGSTVTVSNITVPALGTVATVNFPYPNVSLASEVDNTISVSILASRSDVFWSLGETATVGSSTNVVERCGSVGANNGCTRNFGVPNNFVITMTADVVGTAAGVTVGGRALTAEGRGLRGARVIITDTNGVSRATSTGAFGRFQFEDVEPGQTYIVTVGSRRFTFSPQVVQVNDNIADLNFIAGQ